MHSRGGAHSLGPRPCTLRVSPCFLNFAIYVMPGYYPTPVCLGRVWYTAMSHGHGDLSHPVFWGNHVLLPNGCIARSCLFPCLATALGTPVCLAVWAEKLCNSKIKLRIPLYLRKALNLGWSVVTIVFV